MNYDTKTPWHDISYAYNVAVDDPMFYCDDLPVFVSEPNIPHIEEAEVYAIESLIKECTAKYMQEMEIDDINQVAERVFDDRSSIDGFRGDRTMQIAIVDCSLILLSYFTRLQDILLARCPLWRICIVLTTDIVATILPHRMYFDPASNAATQKEAVENWRKEVNTYIDVEYGATHRQIREVKQIVRGLFESNETITPPVSIAVYNDREDDEIVVSVWILSDGDSPYAYLYEGDYVGGIVFRVTTNGELLPHEVFDVSTGWWLQQLLVPLGTSELIVRVAKQQHIHSRIPIRSGPEVN